MASADALITRGGPVAAPLEYTVPASGAIQPLVVTATFSGAAAASVFEPELQIIAPDGQVIARCPVQVDLAVGGAADVSWFPGGRLTPEQVAPFTPGTWVRVAEPLIQATVAWENGQVQGAKVRFEAGTYKMWFGGGGASNAIGFASCAGNPTIPADWTKYVSNPIIGQGGSGIAGYANGISIVKVAGTYHAFYYDTFGGGNLKRTTSADGLAWTAPTTAIAAGSVGGTFGWATSQPWFDGTNWWLFVEASLHGGGGGGPPFGCYLFKNASIAGDGAWVVQNGGAGLTSLSVAGYTQGYGEGPNLAEIDGTPTFQIGAADVLWYGVLKTGSGSFESDITHATSIDPALTSWAPASVFDLIHNAGPFEPTEVGSPCVIEVAGKSYLFFAGQDAATFDGVISLATFDGTLVQLLNGTQGVGTIASVIASGGALTVNNSSGPTVTVTLVEAVDGGSA